ncbi:MAG: lysophospholipid acyltransferase family protein [Planctomycetia bacterium]|nr:lysophospholipid acyltransferase family protein [Planctomycetia bacterium]
MNTTGRNHDAARKEDELPPFSTWLHEWFMWYVRRYLRRHFHAVRLLRGEAGGVDRPEIADQPVIFYSNHPGWWDPLTFLFVGQSLFPNRMVYGPIDAAALGKYKFLERIGFIGIDPHAWRGAARFLRMLRAAGKRTDVIFWITAQGEFTDPRGRPVRLRPGVGHGVAAAERGVVVPLAVEYPFWNERLPEVVVAFGPAIRVTEAAGRSAEEWTDVLARHLEATQDGLAEAAQSRDPKRFTTLLTGRVGVGFVYDAVRRIKAWIRGERFDASHGDDAEGATG